MTNSTVQGTGRRANGYASHGDVIAFPLSTGGWGLGLVTRGYQFGKLNMLYTYGLNLRSRTRPSVDTIDLVDRTRILTWCHHSDPLIRNGEWPILGKLPNFSLEEWIWPPSAPSGSMTSWNIDSDVLHMLDEATLTPVQVPMRLISTKSDLQSLDSTGGMGDASYLAARVEDALVKLESGRLRKPENEDWNVWERINQAAVRANVVSDPTYYRRHSNAILRSDDTIQPTQKLKQAYSRCASWNRLAFYFEQLSNAEEFNTNPAVLKAMSALLSRELYASCKSLAVEVKVGSSNVIIDCIGKKEQPQLVDIAAEVGRRCLPKGFSLVVPAKTSMLGTFTPRREFVL